MKNTFIITLLITLTLQGNEIYKKYRFDKEGLPVSCGFYYEKNDNIWFANSLSDGDFRLAKFDSEDFTTYYFENSSINDLEFNSIKEESDTLIWAVKKGSQNVLKYDLKEDILTEFEKSDIGLEYDRLRLRMISSNVKWFTTFDSGVVSFDDTIWRRYDSTNSTLKMNYAKDVFLYNKKTWFNWYTLDGRKGGLSYFDGESWGVYDSSNTPLRSNAMDEIFVDGDDLWVGTNEGIALLSNGENWSVWDTLGLDTLDIGYIDKDHNGSIWVRVGSDYRIWNGQHWIDYDFDSMMDKYGNGLFHFVTNEDTLYETKTHGIYQKVDTGWHLEEFRHIDHQGIEDATFYQGGIEYLSPSGLFWYHPGGGYQGIIRFDGEKWEDFTPYNTNLSNDTIHTIHCHKKGTKWISTAYGLSLKNENSWSLILGDTAKVYNSSSIISDGGNGLWLASDKWRVDGALCHYDGEKWTTYSKANSDIPSTEINDLLLDKDNNLWIAHQTGITKYNGTTWENWDVNDLPGTPVKGIAQDSNGFVYIATQGGLSRFSNGKWDVFESEPLLNKYQFDIAIDSNDNVWLASLYDGVLMFDGESVTAFGETSGLSKGRCESVEIDTFGRVWITTDSCGILKYDGTEWRTYNTENSSLMSNHTSCISFDIDGSKWIGTKDSGVVHLTDDDTLTVSVISSDAVSKDLAFSIIQKKSSFSINGISGNGLFNMYSLAGKRIFSRSLNEKHCTIEVPPNIARGIYFIKIEDMKKSKVLKTVL